MARLLLSAALLFIAPAVFAADVVPCESFGGDARRECRVASSGTIILVSERSEELCREGISWGTASEGVVWVSRGCRALFRAKSTPGAKAVCESLGGNRTTCTVDTTSGVTLHRQLSTADCLEGESWGYQDGRDEVWVDRGCRAEFLLSRTGTRPRTLNALNTMVLCESNGRRRTECTANTTEGVQIVRTLGDVPCKYGTQWGYDAKTIWVAGGCRAEFATRGDAKATATALECESQNLRRNCEADTRFGVALVRQLGEKKCILNETWGFDETAVWVTDGCHARFALGGFRLPEDAVPPTALRLTCQSSDQGEVRCPANASRGAGLIKQLSEADCVLNRTWGYDAEGVWVSNGCGAEFAIAK